MAHPRTKLGSFAKADFCTGISDVKIELTIASKQVMTQTHHAPRSFTP
jgi:hypothetical protein